MGTAVPDSGGGASAAAAACAAEEGAMLPNLAARAAIRSFFHVNVGFSE